MSFNNFQMYVHGILDVMVRQQWSVMIVCVCHHCSDTETQRKTILKKNLWFHVAQPCCKRGLKTDTSQADAINCSPVHQIVYVTTTSKTCTSWPSLTAEPQTTDSASHKTRTTHTHTHTLARLLMLTPTWFLTAALQRCWARSSMVR